MTSLTSSILMMGDGLAHGFLENLKVTAVSLLGLGSLDGWRYSGGTQAGIFFFLSVDLVTTDCGDCGGLVHVWGGEGVVSMVMSG